MSALIARRYVGCCLWKGRAFHPQSTYWRLALRVDNRRTGTCQV